MTNIIHLGENNLWLASLEDVYAFYEQSLTGSTINPKQTYGFEVELDALQQQKGYVGHLANSTQVQSILSDLQAAKLNTNGAIYTLDLAQQLEFASAPCDSITTLYHHGKEAEELLQKIAQNKNLRLSALSVHPSANWSDPAYLNYIERKLIFNKRTELVIPSFQRSIDNAKQRYSAHHLLATCGIHTTFSIHGKAALEETLTLIGAITPLIAAANYASPFSFFDSTQNSAREVLWDASLTSSDRRFGLPPQLSGQVTLEDVIAHIVHQPMWYGIDLDGNLHEIKRLITFQELILNGGLQLDDALIAPTLEQYVNHACTCYNSYRVKPTFTDDGTICLAEFRIPDGGGMDKAVMNVALIHGLTHNAQVRGQLREILECHALLNIRSSKQEHYKQNKILQQQLLQHGLQKVTLLNGEGTSAVKVWQKIVDLACGELFSQENTPEMQQVLQKLQATIFISEASRHRQALQRIDAEPEQLSKPHYADKLDLVTGYTQFGEQYELPPSYVLYHQSGSGR